MNTNYLICRNEVYIENKYVGQFESFTVEANSRQLGRTAVLTIPLYAIGTGEQTGEARSRMREVFSDTVIKPCAQVRVVCWYDESGVSMEKVTVFTGFIEHVSEGFPTKLYLQDNSFILRFGNIQKRWAENATLQTIANDCIPIAEEAFKDERKKQGLTGSVPSLTYNVTDKNVQAYTNALSFRNGIGRSPYETIQHLMSTLSLYGGVTDDFQLYVGAGVEDTKGSTPIGLDTRYNVIDRDIVPLDGRFIDFDVKITGVLANGKQYTATGGLKGGNTGKKKNPYGETFRGFSILNTAEAIQEHADRQLEMLRRSRNKGSISLLLYPKIELFDQVRYTDSLFPELSALYYVLDYRFTADNNGYFQRLGVTDQIYAL